MITLIRLNSLKLAIAWACIIFILCCTPGQYIPSANWLQLLSFDKLVHASIFFILVCLWLIYFNNKQKLTNLVIYLILTLCILYGGLLEIMQATVFSNRSGDWFDFIANTLGCLMGYFCYSKKIVS